MSTPADKATDGLMDWIRTPGDASLTRQAKALIDERFPDPQVVFSIAALALRHCEVSQFPALDKIEGELYQELFSEQRRVTASTGELVQMGKLLLEKKKFALEAANGDGISEKPRIEIRVTDDRDTPGTDASRFSAKQRARLRRALVALSQPDGKK